MLKKVIVTYEYILANGDKEVASRSVYTQDHRLVWRNEFDYEMASTYHDYIKLAGRELQKLTVEASDYVMTIELVREEAQNV